MTQTDNAGYPVSGASAESLAFFERAAHEFRCLIGDPAATIDRALEAAPAMCMAHVLKGWLYLLGTEPKGIAVARACAASAAPLAATERERRHVDAMAQVAHGRWRAGGLALEDLSVRYPRDALALQAGHLVDFYRGDARMLRDRIARALPAWSQAMPGHHAVLGMYAFGLEENGEFDQAEHFGRCAVALEPRDGWAWHAVAHVHEMRNRADDGIAWLQPQAAVWAAESFFAVHNWWHLALFHLERDDVDAVLRLFDGPIFGARSALVLDLIDASALLWRLHLRGVEVGERWQAVADNWLPLAAAGTYAFNDAHAMMAFVGAGRAADGERVLAAQRAARMRDDDNAAFIGEVGAAVTRALQAFGERDYATAVRLLRAVRSQAQRFGGSNAQRDVLDLTLIEAALRGGDAALAGALAAERCARRPRSPLARLFAARAAAATPAEAALAA